MTDPCVDLHWWPHGPNEPIGEACARKLVAELRRVVAPVFHLPRIRLGPEMRTVRVDTMYDTHPGDP